VVAPSLVPKGASERVKTDRRDAVRLARLHRAGELTPIRAPSVAEEAVRDLVRARAAVLGDRKRTQQRLTAMLMRHGRIWRDGCYWTAAHRQQLAAQRFDDPALASAVGFYRAALDTRETELAAIEAELAGWALPQHLAAAAARLLPGDRAAQRADPGRGGGGLAAVRLRAGVHGLHRAGPLGVLQR